MDTPRIEITGLNAQGEPVRLVDENGESLYVGDVIETNSGDIHRLVDIEPADPGVAWRVTTNWGTYGANFLNCRWAR